MSTKINVLLADGRKLVREGLSLLLERHEGIGVIGEAVDAQGAVKLVKALPVDVVILNLASPMLGGLDAVKALVRVRTERPTRIIVLMMNPDAALARGLLEAGASGCLAKEAAGAELVQAIRTVQAGRVYLSPSLVDAVVGGYVRPTKGAARERPLAPRERVILERIAAGESTKEIAAALGVSTRTVETQRRRIMQKLDRHSVAELTKYAVVQGITPLDGSA
jgi:DNA-binding NarL/FixJ family response regulator